MTTRDIILRAEQYANKENADFYSYAEKVSMLNESYISLYQYLLNTGDKYWIKELEIVGKFKEYQLPDDCYQVAAVYKKLNDYKKTQIYNYHLKNNKIVIDQEDYFNKSIIIEYYPTPTLLTYKDDISKCVFSMENQVDIHDGRVLIKNAGKYRLYDTVAKDTFDLNLNAGEYAHIYNDGNIAVYNNGSYTIYNIGKASSINIGNILIVYNNSVFYVADNSIKDASGNIVKELSETLDAGTYITKDFSTLTKIDGILPINGNTYIIPSTATGVTDEQKVYTQYDIKGYYDNAFLTYNATSNTYYVESLYNDTIINYPNNIFYTMIAIDIALKMRSKQGVDNSQLEQQWAMARTSLFNSIEKNKGSHIVIKDVYEDDQLGSIYY